MNNKNNIHEIINSTIEEFMNENNKQIFYHGSPYKFNKFTTSKIGSGSGRQMDGWGIYLTNSKNVAKIYGKYIYEITLLNESELNFIDFGKPVEKDVVFRIIEDVYNYYNKDFDINKLNLYYNSIKDASLPKVNFNDFELITFDYLGFLFYETLSRVLGDDKKASTLLLRNGISGIKRNISNTINPRIDYVIFDENILNIENKSEQ